MDVEASPMMQARVAGTYEAHKVAAIQRLLEPGMTFIDAGANMGDFSLIAAKTMVRRAGCSPLSPRPRTAIGSARASL